jgi:hypothetical protein
MHKYSKRSKKKIDNLIEKGVWLIDLLSYVKPFIMDKIISDALCMRKIIRLIYNCRTKMHFDGLKMQFCRTKNVRLNIRNVGLNWFLSD